MRTIAYDDHVDTVLDVHGATGPPSGTTVVLVHGGFWRERYRRDLMDPLVPSLTAAGHVVVNLEYRRVGGSGGWPTTLTDVAAGVDALPGHGVPVDHVVTVGHSAGGHLAVWLAARHRLPHGAPGAGPRVQPVAAVAQAGVVVLEEAIAARLGDGAVLDLLGGVAGGEPGTDERVAASPADGAGGDRGVDPLPVDVLAARLVVADPAALLPLGVPVVCVHGTSDDTVPVSQSRSLAARMRAAGDGCTVHELAGDHMDVIDPAHPTWAVVLDELARLGGA